MTTGLRLERLTLVLVLISFLPFVPLSQAAEWSQGESESTPEVDERPNIILFIADDVGWNDFGCYGNQFARTPNIDQLAAKGIRFDQFYLTASSCSPSRSSIITGRYPHNNGKAAELHLPISAHLPWFPAMLKEAGYHTVLSGKNHMSVAQPKQNLTPSRLNQPWVHTSGGRKKRMRPKGGGNQKSVNQEVPNQGGHADWVNEVRNRPLDKPFFFWFASFDAHRQWDADRHWDAGNYGPKHKPDEIELPPFLVDTPTTRQDIASYYNEVTRFDYFVGQVVNELKKQNALDNTLLLVMADNGRPFPRAKTRLHDSGMKSAFVAHWPGRIARRGVSNGIVSAVDIAPTLLTLAGIAPVETMQGVSFAPLLDDPSRHVRQFAFSEHNWHDFEAHGRSIRTSEYLLIKNFRPQFAWQGPADSVRSPSHQDLLGAKTANQLTLAQADVLLEPRPEIELYLTTKDPNQLTNLANDPKYDAVKLQLLGTLERWRQETRDSVPDSLSIDAFDRQTGKKIAGIKESYRSTTPGEDLDADQTNASGPR